MSKKDKNKERFTWKDNDIVVLSEDEKKKLFEQQLKKKEKLQ